MPVTIKWGQDREKIYITFNYGMAIGFKTIKETKYSFDDNDSFIFEYNNRNIEDTKEIINESKFCLPFFGEINKELECNVIDTENSKRFTFYKKESNLFWKQLLKDKLLYSNLISVDWSRWQDEDSSEDEHEHNHECGNECDHEHNHDQGGLGEGMDSKYLDMMRNMEPEKLKEMMANLQDDDDDDEQEDEDTGEQGCQVEDDNEDDNDEEDEPIMPSDIDPEKMKELLEMLKGKVPDNSGGIKSMLESMGANNMPGMPGMDGKSNMPGIPNLEGLPDLDSIDI